ncbi:MULTISPECIES: multiple monosaccharide ABC transporter permease [Nocardiopsis]|uniref:Xylose transport system permease protein XylH n=1 Tax=Nocardiopsis sinuspersici TaxID=501010 RepID=A0A1V3BX67_9ACTN|nr:MULTISPECIES: multiple monosaccharide ABC transporter permease [Nocardiopsis]NYH54223.1 putative multiple sugar transport system permease protein [Nocardiopsis sinuspersici]OOC53048.1 sugar ABC transporter permease [Nocardiopsis sinuspersici]
MKEPGTTSRLARIGGTLMGGNSRQYGMAIALVAIIVLFQMLTGGLLLTPLNVTNLIMQNSYILILAIGMMLVIVTGHIDLSVGSVVAFTGAVSAIMLTSWGLPTVVVVPVALLLGALIGAWQGFWVAYVRVPAFIVTLAGMLIFRGATLAVLGGESVAPLPQALRDIASGFLPGRGGEGLHLPTLLLGALGAAALVWIQWGTRSRSRGYGLPVAPAPVTAATSAVTVMAILAFTYVLADYNGLPVVGLLLVALIAGYSFVMRSTTMGRRVYAVGGSEQAAALSGIRTQRTTFWVFVNMGVLSGLAGIVFTARLNAATPGAGTMFELDAIAAAFIGGASASGGVGTVVGAVIGALVMGVLNNGMSLIGLGVDWQQLIKGLVLLLAVAFDIYNKRRVATRPAASAASRPDKGGEGAGGGSPHPAGKERANR